MSVVTKANGLSSQIVSLFLIIVGSTLAVIAYIHRGDPAVVGQMFTFAGGIITGAFALLRGDATKTETTESPGGATTTNQTIESPQVK